MDLLYASAKCMSSTFHTPHYTTEVVITTRADGHVEMWNTASMHHKPVAYMQVSSVPVTALCLLRSGAAAGIHVMGRMRTEQ